MSDWFDKGWDKLIKEIADDAKLSPDKIQEIYGMFADYGLTDYDLEKEAILEIYLREQDAATR